MSPKWNITVWGVRGSAPQLAPDCSAYGGNTVCTALEQDGQIIVLDAGTGLSALGDRLKARGGVRRIDLLLSHFHIDHLMGLFSFAPLFDAGLTIHVYGGAGLRQALQTLVAPPFWPLRLADFAARVELHELCPGERFALGGVAVSTMAGDHPGGSLLYRLENGAKSVVYALDHEAQGPTLPALTAFARASDLLIWDANFTDDDLRPGWGHSTWRQGLALGRAAGVRQVLMTHYSRGYSDAFLRRQEAQAESEALCRFAREGEVIVL